MSPGSPDTLISSTTPAFQLGIGVSLLLAVAWRDGLALVLAGFVVANTTHVINHAVDLDLGGHSGDRWGLAALRKVPPATIHVGCVR